MKQGHIHLFIHCSLHTLQSTYMKQEYLGVQSTYIVIYSFIYIHCNLFIHLQYTLQSIHFIHLFDRSNGGFWQIDLGVPVADVSLHAR
jgi:hypothetical protein